MNITTINHTNNTTNSSGNVPVINNENGVMNNRSVDAASNTNASVANSTSVSTQDVAPVLARYVTTDTKFSKLAQNLMDSMNNLKPEASRVTIGDVLNIAGAIIGFPIAGAVIGGIVGLCAPTVMCILFFFVVIFAIAGAAEKNGYQGGYHSHNSYGSSSSSSSSAGNSSAFVDFSVFCAYGFAIFGAGAGLFCAVAHGMETVEARRKQLEGSDQFRNAFNDYMGFITKQDNPFNGTEILNSTKERINAVNKDIVSALDPNNAKLAENQTAFKKSVKSLMSEYVYCPVASSGEPEKTPVLLTDIHSVQFEFAHEEATMAMKSDEPLTATKPLVAMCADVLNKGKGFTLVKTA